MQRLSLLSACIFALFLASCGGSGGGGVADQDGDGVPDSKDLCKNSLDENFISSSITDADSDGCRDAGEDTDDDNDTVLDVDDVDDDNDGLIEIHDATELNNIRNNLYGTHYNDLYNSSNAGCPTADPVGPTTDPVGPTTDPVGCKGYELTNDIRLADLTGTDTSNWVPVGRATSRYFFTAILEGNGNTISNLIIVSDTQNIGFFLALYGTVQNLSFVEGSIISTRSSDIKSSSRIGVLAGRNNGTISGVTAGLSVSAGPGRYNYVGGLVGSNYGAGIIQNSSATGTVNVGNGNDNYNYAGGLVGENLGGNIQNSYATGTVNGNAGNDTLGGLLGSSSSNGNIQNSYATGTVNGNAGNDTLGSLVGSSSSNATIQNSYATGTVNGNVGNDTLGGLVGNLFGTIQDSYATGTLNGNAGDDYVGGLLGYSEGSTQNSYATGNITGNAGEDYVGGLAGYLFNATTQNSYATGTVNGNAGEDYVGGLVGYFLNGTIQNIYATGNITGGADNDLVGGLVGYADSGGTISNSYSLSDVDGGRGADRVGRLLGIKDSGITPTNIYYHSGSTLSNGTELAIGTSSDDLKALTATGTGWNAFNWDFGSTSQYPSLKSYTEDTDASGNPIQIDGTLLCGQLPEADFVQCPMPTP